MKVLVGTSGWSYKEWKGSFYPEKMPAEEMLRFYGERFPSVEVNNSFYRIPSEHVLAGWAEQVPEQFRFIMKASRRITHNNRLNDEDGSLAYFLRAVNPSRRAPGPHPVSAAAYPQKRPRTAEAVSGQATPALAGRHGVPPCLLVRRGGLWRASRSRRGPRRRG